ncbi:MAG TPA: alpha/beta fold hydrolase [Syntrophales bacterium]|nr:alpha/beta fold hydrolase [Syntrophales bacterium]
MTKRLVIVLCLCLVIAMAVCSYWLTSNKVQQTIFSAASEISEKDDSLEWFKRKITRRLKGVALVVHGLNLRPDRMLHIVAELNNVGIDVLNLSLRGHGRNYLECVNISPEEARLESFRNVTYGLWSDEVYKAYLKVRERASKKNVPVFFIGYSLGGLLGCDLLLSHSDVFYDRMVLFAPALNVTTESYLLKALMPFPNIVIDSLSPISYRTNEGTPMAAYKALFEAIEHFEKNADSRLNIPTAVFIDERDEFISCSKLKEMIVQKNLDQWQLHTVQKDNNSGEKISHHLIINRDNVGEDIWKQIKRSLGKHLKGGA